MMIGITVYLLESGTGVTDPGWGGARRNLSPSSGLVLVRGGDFLLGDDWPDPSPDAPPRRVRVKSFLIDSNEVTNQEFDEFVRATKYVTTAEKEGGGWIYRGGERDWIYQQGADWRHPLGSGSSIAKTMDHPVVLVSWEDAAAYAKWAGKRLPTEAEWEVAARGGLSAVFAQHNSHPTPAEDGSANVWQGRWPSKNHLKDGYFYTAPVGSFRANAIGIFDMVGNVWEWTGDWYDENFYRQPALTDPTGPSSGTLKVARGGSWFCSSNYCGAYRPGFRGKSPPSHAFNNVGFRCAKDVEEARQLRAGN